MTSDATPKTMQNDIASLKTNLVQLQERHAAGQLAQADYERDKAELERRLLDQVLAAPAPATSSARLRTAVWVGAGAALLVIAGVMHWWQRSASSPSALAHPQAMQGEFAAQPASPHGSGYEQINAMTDRLASRLKNEPNDAEGWAMLARSYGALGREAEAQEAYKKAIALNPKDATLAADYRASTDATNPKVASAASISGTVSLAAALRSQVQPDDTVFISARAADGDSRMPLAVLRKQVRDLPIRFTLDDSAAIAPAARLSGATRVLVTARVSRSGDAALQSGDLSSRAVEARVGASGLRIEISSEVKP